MSESERLLKLLLVELRALRQALAPETKTAPKSEASVSSLTRESGVVRDNDSLDVPSQLESDVRSVGPMGKSRRVTKIKDRQGDPRGE